MASRWTRGHSSPITLQLVGPQTWTEVPALLCYDVGDPYAIRIAFGEIGDGNGAVDPDDGGISWLGSRELLQAGSRGPTRGGGGPPWAGRAAGGGVVPPPRAPRGAGRCGGSRAPAR